MSAPVRRGAPALAAAGIPGLRLQSPARDDSPRLLRLARHAVGCCLSALPVHWPSLLLVLQSCSERLCASTAVRTWGQGGKRMDGGQDEASLLLRMAVERGPPLP